MGNPSRAVNCLDAKLSLQPVCLEPEKQTHCDHPTSEQAEELKASEATTKMVWAMLKSINNMLALTLAERDL